MFYVKGRFKMNVEELIEKLKELQKSNNGKHMNHIEADNLLLDFIGDEDVYRAFKKIEKWYA